MRKLTALALATGLMAVVMAPAAVALPAETTTCQDGADNDLVGPWEEWTSEQVLVFVTELGEARGYTEQQILDRWAEIMGFNDHNGDGSLCVMVHYLPNDASGTDQWWSLQDNHYDPPQNG